MKSLVLLNCNIAGFTYYDGIDVFDELKIGTQLQLEAEPQNTYNQNAVKVFYKNTMIGYLPNDHNEDIAKFLWAGWTNTFEVKINRITPDTHPEKQIGITIKIRENK